MADLVRYDGHDAGSLARLLGVPRVVVFDSTASTMDDAHGLAAVGARAGTLVLADRQTAGRGRGGRRWASESGRGVWMTIIERPDDPEAVAVLSIRLGLRAASVLERHAPRPVRLKWPNDIFSGSAKVAGILVEARWRATHIDWVAIGLGVNVREPAGVAAGGALRPGVDRVALLAELVPAVRAAAAARGPLATSEVAAFATRDLAAGHACVEPVPGVVHGITPSGELLVRTGEGVRAFRDGSLILGGAAR